MTVQTLALEKFCSCQWVAKRKVQRDPHQREQKFHKESLELFGCFRGLKQHLSGVFRGLKYGRTFLEFSGALNSSNYAVSEV